MSPAGIASLKSAISKASKSANSWNEKDRCELIKQFEENYAVRDKQDVLAMCALQFASQLEQKQIDNSIDGKETMERIKKINNLLISYLDK